MPILNRASSSSHRRWYGRRLSRGLALFTRELDTESEDLHGFVHGLLVDGSLFLRVTEFLRLLLFDVVFDGVVHGEVVFCGFGEGADGTRELGGIFEGEVFALCLQLEKLVVEQFDVELGFLENVVLAAVFGEHSCDRSIFPECFSCP